MGGTKLLLTEASLGLGSNNGAVFAVRWISLQLYCFCKISTGIRELDVEVDVFYCFL